jgi:hypothetical protein
MNLPIIEEYNVKTGEAVKFFLCGCLHFGSDRQDVKRLRKDFDRAKREGAQILIVGDWGDFILPQDKKRYHTSRDTYHNDTQITSTIDEAFNFLKDYADNLLLISTGNHEATISKFHSIDPTQLLIYRLRHEAGAKKVHHGQYLGLIRLRFGRGEDGGSNKLTYDMFYRHGIGSGSSANASVGQIKAYMASYVADLYLGAHTHSPVVLPCETMIYLSKKGAVKHKERKGIVVGCYSNAETEPYDAMNGGYRPDYGEEKMRSLQGSGGAMLELTYTTDNIEARVTV